MSTQTRARSEHDQVAAPAPPDVRLQGVRKTYGEVVAVDRVEHLLVLLVDQQDLKLDENTAEKHNEGTPAKHKGNH